MEGIAEPTREERGEMTHLAITDDDDLVHLLRSTEEAPWALHCYADRATLCGMEATGVLSPGEWENTDPHGEWPHACLACVIHDMRGRAS